MSVLITEVVADSGADNDYVGHIDLADFVIITTLGATCGIGRAVSGATPRIDSVLLSCHGATTRRWDSFIELSYRSSDQANFREPSTCHPGGSPNRFGILLLSAFLPISYAANHNHSSLPTTRRTICLFWPPSCGRSRFRGSQSWLSTTTHRMAPAASPTNLPINDRVNCSSCTKKANVACAGPTFPDSNGLWPTMPISFSRWTVTSPIRPAIFWKCLKRSGTLTLSSDLDMLPAGNSTREWEPAAIYSAFGLTHLYQVYPEPEGERHDDLATNAGEPRAALYRPGRYRL